MDINMYICIYLHISIFSIHKIYMHKIYVYIYILANMMRNMKDYYILMC